MTRKEAREEAFILIFERQFNNDPPEEILAFAEEIRGFTADDYIRDVFFGTWEHLEEIDAVISEKAVRWKIDRISKIALAVLRLAICEIRYIDSIPVSVSINEAVELCKKYATQDDASFVNGILASAVRGRE